MRDSLGGTVTFVIIIIFMVFALGYLAYSVNYTKAFRMNDKILSLYNEYDGKCDSSCQKKIIDYAQEIGYRTSLKCSEGEGDNKYFCAIPQLLSCPSEVGGDTKGKYYYKIITKINIQIPVLSNILKIEIGNIGRDTKAFEFDNASKFNGKCQ